MFPKGRRKKHEIRHFRCWAPPWRFKGPKIWPNHQFRPKILHWMWIMHGISSTDHFVVYVRPVDELIGLINLHGQPIHSSLNPTCWHPALVWGAESRPISNIQCSNVLGIGRIPIWFWKNTGSTLNLGNYGRFDSFQISINSNRLNYHFIVIKPALLLTSKSPFLHLVQDLLSA